VGPRHPYTEASLANLAVAAAARRDLARAGDQASAAADALAAALGPRHPYTLGASTNVAILAAVGGDSARALHRLGELSDRTGEVLGEDHPMALRCLANLALVRRRLAPGSSGGGIEDRLVQRLGAGHPAVVSMRDGAFLYRVLDPHPY
jgi:hypothetical protein